MKTIEFDIKMKDGDVVNLATGLVHNASRFISDMTLTVNDGTTVDLKSILGVMSVYAANGRHAKITINGTDEDTAYAVLAEFTKKFSA